MSIMSFFNYQTIKSTFSILIIAVLLSSCSGSPENLKVIPKETISLVSIDVFSLIKKGELDKLSELESVSSFMEEVKSEDKDAANILDGLLNDPTKLGIDFRKHIYAYGVKNGESGILACLSAELWNSNKIEDLIAEVAEASGMPLEIKEAESCKYLMLGPAAMGWDDDKLLLVSDPNSYFGGFDAVGTLNKLFALDASSQITAVDGFDKFLEGAKDMDAWLSMDFLAEERELREAMEMLNYDISGSTMTSHLSFNDDNITLNFGMKPGEGMMAKIKEYNVFNNSFDANLLDYLPEKYYAVGSYSVDPLAYYKLLKSSPEFEEIKEEFKKETDMEVLEVVESIGGNVAFSLYGMEEMEYTAKVYGYSFDESKAVKEESGMKINELGYIGEDGKQKLNDGETIESNTYNGYCFNIKNVLAEGGDLESAMANNSEVNWYRGGWSFGKNIEKTTREVVPLFAVVGDLKDKAIMEKLMSKIPEGEIEQMDGFIKMADGGAPFYFIFDDNKAMITNDLKSIEAFKNGGVSNGDLGDSDVASAIADGNYYGYINLNLDDYPAEAMESILGSSRMLENPTVRLWANFVEAFEVKEVDDYNGDLILHVKDDGENSLKEIIDNIDESL